MMLRGTQINYMPDKSHVIIITIKGLQIPFTARTLPFGPRKGAFQRWQFVNWPRVVIIMPLNYKLPVPTTFFHKQQCTLILIFFPLQMGSLLTNAWRIESSSVRLYTNLRSWRFF